MKRVHVERSRKADGLEPRTRCVPSRDDESPVLVRVGWYQLTEKVSGAFETRIVRQLPRFMTLKPR
jgi:hypothetical protein